MIARVQHLKFMIYLMYSLALGALLPSSAAAGAQKAMRADTAALEPNPATRGPLCGHVAAASFAGDATSMLVYCTDPLRHVVRRCDLSGYHSDPTGACTVWAGVEGVSGFQDGPRATPARSKQAPALLNQPAGICQDADSGDVYVVDGGNYVLRRIEHDTGIVSTVLGRPHTEGAADGVGEVARLGSGPMGLSCMAASTMALADPGNHRLLLVHPDGSDPSSPDDDSDGKDRTSKHGHVLIKPWVLGLCLLGAFLSGVVASTGMQYTGAVAGAILSRRLAERIANLRLRHRRDGCGGPNQQVHSYQAICGTDVEDATATALHASLTPSTSQSSGRFLTFLRPKAAAGKTAGAVQSEGHPNVAALAASGPITNGSTARGGGDWEQNLVMAPAGAVHSTAAEGEGSSSGEAAAAPVGAATAELISFAEDGEEEDGAAGLAPHTGSAKDLLS